MFSPTDPKHRIVAAAIKLAEDRDWNGIALAEIADAAGTTLVELKQHFASKVDILTSFTRITDDEVLRRAPRRTPGQADRDALFEVLMTRFDCLLPYKRALRSIVAGRSPDPAHVRALLTAQHWMLEAAGIDTSGLGGGVRVAGLASVYAGVFRTWLADDDPGQARTMAALDRRLRSGERSLRTLEDGCAVVRRVGDLLRGATRARSAPTGDAAAEPPAAGPA